MNPIDIFRQRRAAAREAAEELFQARAEANRREAMRHAYLEQGGDEFYFEQSYPRLRQRAIEEEAVAALRKGRRQ
jgi:hypothetical protein